MLQCTSTWGPRVFPIITMPKIPEISVGSQMESSSDRNIQDHFWRWSTYFGRPKFAVSFLTNCPTSLHLCREFGKEIKDGKSLIPLGWPGLIANVVPFSSGIGIIIISTPHVINTVLGHYARFWIFWWESFRARGSRLGLAGLSMNSLPQDHQQFYECFQRCYISSCTLLLLRFAFGL